MKPPLLVTHITPDWSPPVRGRGLKQVRDYSEPLRQGRPPCGGVD